MRYYGLGYYLLSLFLTVTSTLTDIHFRVEKINNRSITFFK